MKPVSLRAVVEEMDVMGDEMTAYVEDFSHSVEGEELQEELLYAIRGRGAFRRFKGMIHRRGVQEDWYRFRTEYFAINNDLI